MSNMSYCRFENTLSDLRECLEILSGHDEESSINSKSERRAAIAMVEAMVTFVVDMNVLDEDAQDPVDTCRDIVDRVCLEELRAVTP